MSNKRSYTKHSLEVLAQIVELDRSGMARADIASKLDVKLSLVHSTCAKAGIRQRKQRTVIDKYPPGTTDSILELRKQGVPKDEIASRLGLDINKVLSDISKNKITLTDEQLSNNYRKYPVDVRDKVVELRQSGMSQAKIAEVTGLTLNTVGYMCESESVTLTSDQRRNINRQYFQDTYDTVVSIRKTGATRGSISNDLDISMATVKRILNKTNTSIPEEVSQRNSQEGKQEYYSRVKQQFIDLVKSKKGSFEPSLYVDTKTHITMMCDRLHKWETIPNSIMNGTWCPKCSGIGPSKAQIEIVEYVQLILPEFEVKCDALKILPGKQHLDVYVPDIKFAIEFNGMYRHSTAMSNFKPNKEIGKALFCQKAGIKFMMIYDDEWESKRDLVKAMIRWRTKRFVGKKLNARKLELRRLSKNVEWSAFFDRNHLDGTTKASFGYGLFLENELVMCATVRSNFRKEAELARLASSYDYSIRGGASRLITAIRKELGSKSLITFSNNRLSSGEVYKKLKAVEITESNRPSYFYTDGNSKHGRIWRFQCKRINDPEVLARFPDVAHTEQAQALGGVFSEKIYGDWRPLYKVEDCGHRKWLFPPFVPPIS